MKDNSIIKTRDGANESLWQAALSLTEIRPIEDQGEIYDVVIIGGGITGVSTALNLQRSGKKCIIVEAKNLGFGTTGGTSAHLNTFLDATYPEIDSDFGKDASMMMAAAAKETIAGIKKNIDSLGIDADFEYRDAYLFSQNEKESKQLVEIFTSSEQAGVAVDQSSENGLPVNFEKALKFPQQAQFHPIKYILGLAKEFLRLGGDILEQCFVESTEFEDGAHQVKTPLATFKAENLVWATHIPPGINILSLRNAPYRSYVLGIKLNSGNYPDCLSYDMQEPYHYFRSHVLDGEKYLLIGGADHKTGHEDPGKAFSDLENYARENFDVKNISYRWSSQYYVPVDGLPYIGKLPGGDERSFVATGFNGNGMILGSLAARILAGLINGNESDLSKLLSPSRIKPISGFMEFVKENADVAYHLIADRFKSKIIHSASELKNDEGKIVTMDGEKLALYKDADGKAHALNPVCTHAGCIVNWNSSEKSWDCPCHGGRFDADGNVLTGPPKTALVKVHLTAEG